MQETKLLEADNRSVQMGGGPNCCKGASGTETNLFVRRYKGHFLTAVGKSIDRGQEEWE